MGLSLNLELYLVTDPVLAGNRSLETVVERALRGGVTLVQFRDKQAPTRSLVERARALVALCHRKGVPLLVNDRVDVALAVGADGVHVGQEDMAVRDVRRLLGPQGIIGVSVRTEQEVLEATTEGATYLAANGVWATATKSDFGEPLGLEGLERLVRSSTLPMVAIGGITAERAGEVRRVGAAGVAVVSALLSAADPEAAARELRATS